MDAKLEPVLIVQKLMDLETVADPKQIVYVGPTQKTIFRYAASSFSDSNIIFNNITAPSLTTVMKRCVKIAMTAQVRVVSVATNAGAGVFKGYTMNAVSGITQGGANDIPALVAGTKPVYPNNVAEYRPSLCLRACPLGSVISSADIRLNGGSTNVALSDYNLIRQFLASKSDVRRYSSEFPLQADNGAVYENLSITSPFNDTQGSFEEARGGFVATLDALSQAGVDGAITAVYTVKWTEQLFISPFLTGRDQTDTGLVNVNNLTISLRLNNLRNMLSAVPTLAASAPQISCTLLGQDAPTLIVEFDSQNSILAQRSPAVAIYDYLQLQTYQTVVPANGGEIPLASLRLPTLPKRIFLFVAPTTGARTPFISDHFMRISRVSVNFNDKSALLATMGEAELYEMSAANAGGSYPTFSQYRFGCGSLIVIDCQKDLSVSESAQAGSQSNFSTLQITLTCAPSNLVYGGAVGGAFPSAVPAEYTAFQVIEAPGLLYLSSSEAQFAVEGASPSETLSVLAKGERLSEDVVDPTGAGFTSILASAFKHRAAIYDLGKKIAGGDVSGGMVSAGSMGGKMHRRA